MMSTVEQKESPLKNEPLFLIVVLYLALAAPEIGRVYRNAADPPGATRTALNGKRLPREAGAPCFFFYVFQ
jgi:hypothetical protein